MWRRARGSAGRSKSWLGWTSLLLALCCLAVPMRAAGEGPVTVLLPPRFDFAASLRPAHFPTARSVPVALTLKGQVQRAGSAGPLPTISGLLFRFEAGLTVDLRSPRNCGGAAAARCATLGHGSVLVFDEAGGATPTPVKGEWTIDAPSRAGRPAMSEFVFPAPIDETLRVPIRVTHASGKGQFTSQMKVTLPRVDGGRAMVHSFALTIGGGSVGKRGTPALTARCPGDGELHVFAEAAFSNDETPQVEAIRECGA
jgi:hypothetical protein